MSERPRVRHGAADASQPGLIHDALLYDGEDDYLAAVVPFVHEGLRHGEAVAMLEPAERVEAVRAAIGAEANLVHRLAPDGDRATPARRIAVLHQHGAALARQFRARVRIVGEAEPGATPREHHEWARYEAVLNRVFAAASRWLVCAYDRRRLSDWTLDAVERAHPFLRWGAWRGPSERYEDPAALARATSPPAPEPDGEPVTDLTVDIGGLATARKTLEAVAEDSGAPPHRAMELAIGLHEVVTNAVEHGGDEARVRCWRDDHRLLCEVLDNGPGFDDPFAGFWPPSPEQVDGRGLWLARQTIDTVELQPRRGRSGLRVVLAATV